MYWATSFCEREQSSKRAWMYVERLWCSRALAGAPAGVRAGALRRGDRVGSSVAAAGGSGVLVAARFIGASVRRRRLALLPSRVICSRWPCVGSFKDEHSQMRIAIVGAGVSGLVAAHLLHRGHEIVVYEAGA